MQTRNHITAPRRRRAILAAIASVAVVATALTGCSSGSNPTGNGTASGDNPYHLVTPGTLTVGINLVNKPERYLDKDGKPAGYDVTLVKMVAKDMGLTLDLKNLDWNGLIPGLQAGTFDLVSNGVGVTPERKKIITFTKTYYDPYQIVMAVPVNSTAPATKDAWNKPGITLVGQQASIAAEAVAKSFPKATFKAYPDMNAAILEVASGRADGAVLESYGVVAYSEEHPDEVKPLRFPNEVLPTYYAAWAVQKGNTALADYLSDWLCKKQKSGELAKIYEQEQHAPMPEMPAC